MRSGTLTRSSDLSRSIIVKVRNCEKLKTFKSAVEKILVNNQSILTTCPFLNLDEKAIIVSQRPARLTSRVPRVTLTLVHSINPNLYHNKYHLLIDEFLNQYYKPSKQLNNLDEMANVFEFVLRAFLERCLLVDELESDAKLKELRITAEICHLIESTQLSAEQDKEAKSFDANDFPIDCDLLFANICELLDQDLAVRRTSVSTSVQSPYLLDFLDHDSESSEQSDLDFEETTPCEGYFRLPYFIPNS